MKRSVLVLFAAALVAVFASAWLLGARSARSSAAQAKPLARYHCPMHPSYVSDKPGDCPICGMKLVKIEDEPPAAAPGPQVSGRAAVSIAPEKLQMIGVKSEEIHHGPLARTIRTVGRVAVDERRLHHVHTKYDGYVEHLYVDFTGKFVERGDLLLSIYSPELVATQQEYLLAWAARKRMAESAIPSVARGSLDLLEAARQRLLLWDVRSADIEALEKAGTVSRTVDLHSDVAGYVVQKLAFHGMRVTPADTLFDIADLSQVWVLADVYESDLPLVRVGMMGELTAPYLPGRSWKGAVTYVNPTVEEKTRTIKLRIELQNHDRVLKPDMFVDVNLRAELGTGLSVPESAVIDSGGRKLVFLERGPGRFEPREVALGVRAGAGFQVLSGLDDGDRVVTSANFLLDSESSLRSALQDMGPAAPAAPAHRH